ncbi:hypothetical protein JCM9534A_06250 [Catenuloplanes indicus JCM 9534]
MAPCAGPVPVMRPAQLAGLHDGHVRQLQAAARDRLRKPDWRLPRRNTAPVDGGTPGWVRCRGGRGGRRDQVISAGLAHTVFRKFSGS